MTERPGSDLGREVGDGHSANISETSKTEPPSTANESGNAESRNLNATAMQNIFGSIFHGLSDKAENPDNDMRHRLKNLQRIRLEVKQYVTKKCFLNTDPLEWWKEIGQIKYPLVATARLARYSFAYSS